MYTQKKSKKILITVNVLTIVFIVCYMLYSLSLPEDDIFGNGYIIPMYSGMILSIVLAELGIYQWNAFRSLNDIALERCCNFLGLFGIIDFIGIIFIPFGGIIIIELLIIPLAVTEIVYIIMWLKRRRQNKGAER
ncbi:MAG: hypothetical protein LUH43_03625 [Clostridia bacterium]|nr:hypothetical protein [Clostridia bacterium]